MQNRPIYKYRIEYADMELPPEFPINILPMKDFMLGDEDISSLHAHECLEIGYCYEGAGIFLVENKILTYSQGDVSIIFKNQYHKAQSDKGCTSRWQFLFIDPERLLGEIYPEELHFISRFANGTQILTI